MPRRVLDNIGSLQDALARLGASSRAMRTIASGLSPLDYLAGLDGPTRVAVALSLAICAYIIFASVVRAGRFFVSLAFFALQLAIVFVVVLVLLGHSSSISETLRSKLFL